MTKNLRFEQSSVALTTSALLIAAGCVAACNPVGGERYSESGEDQVQCSPIDGDGSWAVGRLQEERPDHIDSVTPPIVREFAQSVTYAEMIDLDCDGTRDFVGQIVTDSGDLVLLALVATSTGWEEVLHSKSLVAGREIVAIAADLTGSARRDLVTIGSDEGGYIPRIFRWNDRAYAEVHVPVHYFIRFEEQWGPECRRRIDPLLIEPRSVVLMRETISRSSRSGHGADCALPVDTVVIAGDSLVAARE